MIDLAASDDGKAFYLAMGHARVGKLDLEAGRIQPVLETPSAQGLTLSPDGRHLWPTISPAGRADGQVTTRLLNSTRQPAACCGA